MFTLRGWFRTLAVVGLVLAAGYSVAGYIMAGSLQGPGYRTAARVNLAVFGVSVSWLVLLLVRRRRRKDASRPAT